MLTSITLFTIAKHLNAAAMEIEKLENQVLSQKVECATIEETKSEITKDVENGLQETSEKSTSKKSSSKKSTSKKEKVEEAPKEVVNVPERVLTFDIVKEECRKVLEAKGRDALLNILVSFGAKKTSELTENQYNNVFSLCQTTLGVGNEF